jgi:hypothetical protein
MASRLDGQDLRITNIEGVLDARLGELARQIDTQHEQLVEQEALIAEHTPITPAQTATIKRMVQNIAKRYQKKHGVEVFAKIYGRSFAMSDHSAPPDTQLMAYVQRLSAAYPELSIGSARLHTAEGQFNDILIVNEALIFRFPRSPYIAATLAAEAALLTRLHGRLPLPIPFPIYHARDPQTGTLQFMGYRLLPGQLRRGVCRTLRCCVSRDGIDAATCAAIPWNLRASASALRAARRQPGRFRGWDCRVHMSALVQCLIDIPAAGAKR